MKESIIRFGIGTGLAISVINIISLELGFSSMILGMAVMIFCLCSIFWASKCHNQAANTTNLTIITAFSLALGITVIASFIYVLMWEGYFWATDYKFIDSYADAIIASAQQSEANQQEMEIAQQNAIDFRGTYENTVSRITLSILEILPTGLVLCILNALIFRSKNR